ncbi:MAG: TauD/TfdA family dioxygenase [Actinomycetota bacterium]
MTDPDMAEPGVHGPRFRPASEVLGPIVGGGDIGAFVEGIDLTDPGAPLPIDAIVTALETHGVLIFRGMPISADRFVALGRALGELEILPEPDKRHPDHPEIFNLTNVEPDGTIADYADPQSVFLRGTQRWHTDSSFREIPCLCTMLYAVEVPDLGGDTDFADMVGAYEALPDDRRAIYEQAELIHSYEYSRANNPGKMNPMSEEERRKYPPVRHPLVRQHPNGSRSLYMGGHVSHIAGEELDGKRGLDGGRALLAELLDFATQPRFLYRHIWQANDLVIWDNRRTLHRLQPYDIANQRRVMRRITVVGTEPVVPVSSVGTP